MDSVLPLLRAITSTINSLQAREDRATDHALLAAWSRGDHEEYLRLLAERSKARRGEARNLLRFSIMGRPQC